ncbi:Methyltransferase FkbM domain-containing protein [Rhizobiales bacterium GAS191]|nr:Methyltransferase FkbM domain-containing protein [Rhizobiales bacterium GAS191]SEE51904.1 Methyltransferase FkbM domain-containing protein [Rhizobiales bacterium GAS188]
MTEFATLVAGSLHSELVTIVDVGAAGGIAPAFGCFLDKIDGFGFDPDPAEVARLNAAKSCGALQYVAGLVGIPADHPLAEPARIRPYTTRNPWSRLAIFRWAEIDQAAKAGLAPPPLSFAAGAHMDATYLVTDNPDPQTVLLPSFLKEHGVDKVDFLKIDVDGEDLLVLQSMTPQFTDIEVMSIGIEVNFFGSNRPTDNTFHNVDRLLKEMGFELFDLTMRRYSMKHLPVGSDHHVYPAETRMGRILQGDAFYARDICAPYNKALAERTSPEGLLKLAAMFSIFGLPDCAAEILLVFGDRLATRINIPIALDGLSRQAQRGEQEPKPYVDYLRDFESRTIGKALP